MKKSLKARLLFVAAVLSLCIGSTACSTKEAFYVTEEKAITSYYEEPLVKETTSDTAEGAAAYGAVIKLGDLDELGRSTYAHIRLKDDQEPGNHGESRNEYISVDPAGWKNFKTNGEWIYNRCHLIGYQFSGLNDELRNLATGTAYVNKGALGDNTDEDNPDSMLYYEQRLDKWLKENPDHTLDFYVAPIYEDVYLIPKAFYMQWVGFDEAEESVAIDIGGHSETVRDNVNGVLLYNKKNGKGDNDE